MSYWSSSSLAVGATAAIVVVLFLGLRVDTTAWQSTSASRGRVEVAVRLNDRRVDSFSSGRTNDSRERETPHERFNVSATRTTPSPSYVELDTVSLSARVDVQPRPSPPPEDVITTVASTTKTTASSSSLPTRILSTEVHTTSGSPIAAVIAPRPPASTGDVTATTVAAASVEVRKCAPPDYAPIPCQNLTDDILKTLVAIEVDAAQGLGCQLLFLVRFFFMADRIGLASFAALTSSRAFRSSNPLHTHDFLRYAFDPCDLTETELRLGQDAVSCGRAPVHHADRVAKLVGTMSEARTRAGLPRKPMIYLPSSLGVGANVVAKHLRVRDDLMAEADAFWSQTGLAMASSRGCTVAVHYRGLDKVRPGKFQEADRLSYDDVLALAVRVVNAYNCTAVLAASDEPGFVEAAMATRWSLPNGSASRRSDVDDVKPMAQPVLVVAAPGSSAAACNRTKECGALHLSEMSDNFHKTREAVMTMVLLSRCTHMVKTPSLFSAFAALLRPDIQVSLTHRGSKYSHEYPERIMPLTEEVLSKMNS